ncbi:MAG: transporter substrate-binding protein [Proteobacteria bacterium]|nr:transporter substrate-binding protein [Pseudomonadota bacterium]
MSVFFRAMLRACGLSALLAASVAVLAAPNNVLQNKSDGTVKIGVLTDMNGAYSAISGKGSVLAAQMAIEDFGGKVLGVPIELVSADHQLSPQLAASIARDWMQNGKVDLVLDIPNSNAAVEVIRVARELNRIAIISSAGSDRISNEECTPNSLHWTYDARAVTRSTVDAIIKTGGNSWYIVTADNLFGQSLEEGTMAAVQRGGGTVAGTARHPFPSNTYASIRAQAAGILKARDSGAKVIAFASTGTDVVNAIKQASRFGIASKKSLAAVSIFIPDIHSVGLYDAQGLYLTTGFYWDLNTETRAWSRRFFARHQAMPSMVQAGIYSAVTHYLKAVQAAESDNTQAVMTKMKAMPVNDFFARNGEVREDGRMVHDMYLMQVKKPEESKYSWDYYHVRQTIAGDKAFAPLSESRCPRLLKAAP